ncbi:MAG: hypothetical protein ACLU2J_01040 [Clostridia bacterium]
MQENLEVSNTENTENKKIKEMDFSMMYLKALKILINTKILDLKVGKTSGYLIKL